MQKLLSTFEKEINVNQEIICLSPKNFNFPCKYFTLDQYLHITNISDIWGELEKWKLLKFDIDYIWEDEDIYKLDNQRFVELLDNVNSSQPDIEKLRIHYVNLIEKIHSI